LASFEQRPIGLGNSEAIAFWRTLAGALYGLLNNPRDDFLGVIGEGWVLQDDGVQSNSRLNQREKALSSEKPRTAAISLKGWWGFAR
jgi:hypothetical protein